GRDRQDDERAAGAVGEDHLSTLIGDAETVPGESTAQAVDVLVVQVRTFARIARAGRQGPAIHTATAPSTPPAHVHAATETMPSVTTENRA
ncbi:hypothetical protein ABTM42_20015, partial [Acinetobacter baumannii]